MRTTEGIIGFSIFIALLGVSFSLFGYLIYRRFKVLLIAGKEYRFDHLGERIKGILIFFLGQKRILSKRYRASGLMHAFIFWGFLVILINTIQLIGSGFAEGFQLPFLSPSELPGKFYIYLKDIIEIIVLLAVIMAGIRRIFIKPQRLTLSWDAGLILILIAVLMITDFMVSGAEAAMSLSGSGSISPAGNLLSEVIKGLGKNAAGIKLIHHVGWWIHLSTLLFFLVYLPLSKHFHIITAIFNIFFKSLKKGGLKKIDIETAENFGVSRIEQLDWKSLLDIYSCTECGRCQDACPAYFTNKPLSPKKLNEDMRHHLYEKIPYILSGKANGNKEYSGPPLVGDVIEDETLWSCTTCMGCEESCPLFIEFINRIVDMRRHLVLEESRFPETLKTIYKNLENNGNPWGFNPLEREKWIQGLDVPILHANSADFEILYWVGCAGALDDRNKAVSVRMVEILRAAGVKFAVLGKEESCTGDPARRSGNEYLFQILAESNIETLKRYNVKRILTQCPHCYNTIKNEYPQFNGNFEVIHHTEFIAGLIDEGRIKLSNLEEEKFTFHDSCYLGRHNDIYEPPRKILNCLSPSSFTEMERHRKNGFCCGAGGGRMWMEEKADQKVNQARVKEALLLNPDTIITACPFCLTMLADGVNELGKGDSVAVKDIAILIGEAMNI